jgi:hypothetical protein
MRITAMQRWEGKSEIPQSLLKHSPADTAVGDLVSRTANHRRCNNGRVFLPARSDRVSRLAAGASERRLGRRHRPCLSR